MVASPVEADRYKCVSSTLPSVPLRFAMRDKHNGFVGDVGNWLRGLCMGCADIVPGISGGTMALILGHYHRLVTAISKIDSQALRLVRKRKLREAAEHIDLRFLAAVAIGMASGVVALASLMHFLLEHHLSYTFAVFTGLILASSVIVGKQLKQITPGVLILAALGAFVAYQICIQQKATTDLTPFSAFLCATVAICAMILPGISGAFVLLLLGVYHPVTELIKGIPKGQVSVDGLLIVAAFLAGCVVGLLCFSRVLRYLLDKYHDRTLGFLAGLMLGSLYKIWPFQMVTAETRELPFKEQVLEHVPPVEAGVSVPMVIVLAVVAIALTFALEWCGNRFADPKVDTDTVA